MFRGCMCLSLGLSFIVAVLARLNVTEGEICRVDGGHEWRCKSLADCQYPYEFLNDERNEPPFCEFTGPKAIVCCDPAFAVSRSNQMCQQYAETVCKDSARREPEGSRKKCGVQAALHEIPASSIKYPHMALLGYINSNVTEWKCAGNLISDRFVLSAAHCTSPRFKPRYVKLGATKIHDKTAVYEIVEIIIHPKYKSSSFYNDIALYQLYDTVKFSETVKPICLQKGHELPHEAVTTVGWIRDGLRGSTDEPMQQLSLTVVPWRTCNDVYNKSSPSRRLSTGVKEDSMICAGDSQTLTDTCSTVSGSSLLQVRKDPACMLSLIGVASFSNVCRQRPGVYSRVSHFVPWIETIVWS